MSESLLEQIEALQDRAATAEFVAAERLLAIETLQRSLDSANRELGEFRSGLKLEAKVRNQAESAEGMRVGMERLRAELAAADDKAARLQEFGGYRLKIEHALGLHFSAPYPSTTKRLDAVVAVARALRDFYDAQGAAVVAYSNAGSALFTAKKGAL